MYLDRITDWNERATASVRTSRDGPIQGVFPRSAGFWAVSAYMVLYIVRPWETLFPELAAQHFERFAYIAILVVVVSSTGLRLRFDAPTAGILIFTATLYLTVWTARNPVLAWSNGDGFYVYLTKILALLLIVSVVRTPYELLFLVIMAVAAVSVYAEKSLWEYLVHGAGRNSMGVVRLRGMNASFGHANALATVLVPVLPWWFFLLRCRHNVTTGRPNWWKSIFTYFLAVVPVLLVTCILFSGSRAGTLGLLMFLFLIIVSSRHRRRRMFVLSMIATIAVWSTLGEANKQRIRSIWDSSAAVAGGEGSKQGRKAGLYAGLAMFESYPLTGVGMGNFGTYRRTNLDGSAQAAHNIPGQLLGETGILGTATFCIMLGLLYAATRSIKRIAQRYSDPTIDMLSALATAVRQTIILLLFLGLANHLAYRFTWIWLGGFCSCMYWLAKCQISQIDNAVIEKKSPKSTPN